MWKKAFQYDFSKAIIFTQQGLPQLVKKLFKIDEFGVVLPVELILPMTLHRGYSCCWAMITARETTPRLF